MLPRAEKQGPISSPRGPPESDLLSNYPPENLSVTRGWERSGSNLLSKSSPAYRSPASV